MQSAHVDLALRLQATSVRLAARLPVGQRTRTELEQLLREARAVVLTVPAAPAPEDPLAAFIAATEAARVAGIAAPELIEALNDTLERTVRPAPKR